MLQPESMIADSSACGPHSLPNDRLDIFFFEEASQKRFTFNGARVGTPHRDCAATTDGFCFRREPFPDNTSFAVGPKGFRRIG
jgi:hypothetical protein